MGQVSIVMAAFESPWIGEAIDSVRAQTRGDWELLVVDDANTLATRKLVADRSDSRIRYIANDVRLGPALTHRRGVELARSDLMAFINHDDTWEPELLSRLVSAVLADPTTVVAFADHWVIDASGDTDPTGSDAMSAKWGRHALKAGAHRPFGALAIVDQAIPIAQCAVWHKDAIQPIPAWAGDRYDYWIQVALAATGQSAVYVPERLARFRIHDSNLGGDSGLRRRLEGAAFYHRLLRSSDLGAHVRHVQRKRRDAVMCVVKWPAARVRCLARVSLDFRHADP